MEWLRVFYKGTQVNEGEFVKTGFERNLENF